MNLPDNVVSIHKNVTNVSSSEPTEPTLKLEEVVRGEPIDHVETLFLGPVERFGLEDFLENRDVENTHTTVEIERLLANGKYQQAYDLYMLDNIQEIPDDFQEFLARHIEV